MHDRDEVHWDFVQIQLNYLDWNASKDEAKRNVNAEYLYNELHRRGIPAVIMEPLLGGRLANVPLAVVDQMKARRPDDSVASWAFRFAGTPGGNTYRTQRHDIYGPPQRQPGHLFAARTYQR